MVTGASRGIGFAIARAILAEGATVVAVARDPDRTSAAVEELRTFAGAESGSETPPRVLAAPADVGDPAAVEALFQRVDVTYGRVDVLVNAAGILHRGPLEQTTPADWEESLRVNLTGVFLCSQAAVRRMLAQPERLQGVRGHIVQIVSGSGVHGWAGAVAYTASKFGVMGLSEVLRDEFRERGIKVTTILPGMVDTDMTAHEDFAERHKLAREDVAHAVLAALTASPQAVLTRVDVRHILPL